VNVTVPRTVVMLAVAVCHQGGGMAPCFLARAPPHGVRRVTCERRVTRVMCDAMVDARDEGFSHAPCCAQIAHQRLSTVTVCAALQTHTATLSCRWGVMVAAMHVFCSRE
jgi:hypothetical protein